MERKPIGKQTRFEVFKRDRFTCQYCGRSAPDVVLEIDHIDPVANGGDNNILNLVTACQECNRGKGARTLDDHAAVKAKRNQLEELAERREQIEMMYEWQLALVKNDERELEAVNDLILELTGYYAGESAMEDVAGWISEFGLAVVLESTRKAFTRYPHKTDEEWSTAFSKIGGICFYSTRRTCSQCRHDIGYNASSHLVRCRLRDYGVKNIYAGECPDYEMKWGDRDV